MVSDILVNIGLTHWGGVTHICIGDLTIIGSDNGLSPGQHQSIIRTNTGILLFEPLGSNFSEILIEILTCSFKKFGWRCHLQNGGHIVLDSMRYCLLPVWHQTNITLTNC